MPHGKMKFNKAWLDKCDNDKFRIGLWCMAVKDDDYKAYCTLCSKAFAVDTSGLSQVLQHAKKGSKHSAIAKCKFSGSQQHFQRMGPTSSTSGAPSSIPLIAMTHAEQVTKAEIVWLLKVCASDYSLSSCDDLPNTFQEMFQGAISQDFSLSSSKASYLISDGLGPYFIKKLVEDVKSSNATYTVEYDETTTSQVHKQMDVLIRYWSDEKDGVVVAFLNCSLFGHAKAPQICTELLSVLEKNALPLKKIIVPFQGWTKR